MKVITLSKKKFEELEPLKLSSKIYNTEGNLYEYNYRGQPKILKKLFHQSGTIFANKLYTIEMLNTCNEYLPDSFYCPDYLISVGNTVSGFTLPRLYGDTLTDILYNDRLNPKEQIYYLKKVGEILQQMKAIRKYTPLNNIYLNDLHDSNFIVNPNKKQLYVIDLDSCKIGANSSFPARFLTPFSLLNAVSNKYQINTDQNIPGYVTADENSDLYCYNIMILNYLYGSNVNGFNITEFYDYLNYLEYIGTNNKLLDIFGRIVTNGDNKNPVNYLDYLTNEQVYRAKGTIYKKIKR